MHRGNYIVKWNCIKTEVTKVFSSSQFTSVIGNQLVQSEILFTLADSPQTIDHPVQTYNRQFIVWTLDKREPNSANRIVCMHCFQIEPITTAVHFNLSVRFTLCFSIYRQLNILRMTVWLFLVAKLWPNRTRTHKLGSVPIFRRSRPIIQLLCLYFSLSYELQ